MERKEAIRGAYRLTGGNNFYDGMITCSTLSGKAVCRLVWDMNKAENDAYLEKAMAGIPENFSGKLLEVPVGTGILTMPLYQTLPQADITCLDYSPDMMGQAQQKAEHLHLENVTFRQGDVGALPFADGAFDIVLSLNIQFTFVVQSVCRPVRESSRTELVNSVSKIAFANRKLQVCHQ